MGIKSDEETKTDKVLNTLHLIMSQFFKSFVVILLFDPHHTCCWIFIIMLDFYCLFYIFYISLRRSSPALIYLYN